MTFWTLIRVSDNGCWLWVGSHHPKGYGLFTRNNITVGAHRYSYLLFTGTPIPNDYDVHHKCNNKGCVNPTHLELVPHNNHPGSASGGNKTKTHCKQGHAFSETNTYWITRPNGSRQRLCRACRRNGMAAIARARLGALK